MEAELATINNAITALYAKDAELDQKIADLKNYVDNELTNYATKEYVNNIFATKEQLTETQTLLIGAQALLFEIQGHADNLELDLEAYIVSNNNEIEKINARLDIIEADIASLNQQIAAINSSIDGLKSIDAELAGYIDALQSTADDLQSKINDTNYALAALEIDLEGQISASEQNVLNELNTARTRMENELATVNNTIATLASRLNTAEDRILSLESAVASCASKEEVESIRSELSAVNEHIAHIMDSVEKLQARMLIAEANIDSLVITVSNMQAQIKENSEKSLSFMI